MADQEGSSLRWSNPRTESWCLGGGVYRTSGGIPDRDLVLVGKETVVDYTAYEYDRVVPGRQDTGGTESVDQRPVLEGTPSRWDGGKGDGGFLVVVSLYQNTRTVRLDDLPLD